VREKTRLSQAEFARLLNVSVKTLQNWEQAAASPPAGQGAAADRRERTGVAVRALSSEARSGSGEPGFLSQAGTGAG